MSLYGYIAGRDSHQIRKKFWATYQHIATRRLV
jgi:hypothetical protein